MDDDETPKEQRPHLEHLKKFRGTPELEAALNGKMTLQDQLDRFYSIEDRHQKEGRWRICDGDPSKHSTTPKTLIEIIRPAVKPEYLVDLTYETVRANVERRNRKENRAGTLYITTSLFSSLAMGLGFLATPVPGPDLQRICSGMLLVTGALAMIETMELYAKTTFSVEEQQYGALKSGAEVYDNFISRMPRTLRLLK